MSIPDVANPAPPKDNHLWKYFDDHTLPLRAVAPGPLTDIVTEENPLEADVCWSKRRYRVGPLQLASD